MHEPQAEKHMDPEFDELKREFLAEAGEKVKEMGSFLATAQGTAPSSKGLERMSYLAHQLKGAGGSYGYPTISTYAAALEETLEALTTSSTAELSSDITRHIQNLASEVDRRSKELAPAS